VADRAGGLPAWQREGPVGLSTRHALAVVAHEGARAADVLFARRLRDRMRERFAVTLAFEPVVWER
jgi:UDP-N-acetylmuramate dehydrogenase